MKQITISVADLLPRKVFVATPMYGGMCTCSYTNSVMRFQHKMRMYGLGFEYFTMANESQINRARNYCVFEFLKRDCTHLLFWDADIEASADDALSLLHTADPASDKDVVFGIYPKKVIRWNRIEDAVRNGVKGDDLAACGADMAFNPGDNPGSFDLYEPLQVPEGPTGFMMIQRRVIEKFIELYPEAYYLSDGRERSDKVAGHIPHCFENYVEPSHRYLTEDFNFCRMVREMGMKVWVAPWLQLNHLGFYKFEGNPQAICASGESAAEAA